MAQVSRKRRRGYDSSLRQEQARQTRQRIVEAVAALLADGEDDFSIARVAERSGASEPTIYRHFSNREALLDAVNDWLSAQMRPVPMPTSLDGMPLTAAAGCHYFADNEPMIRAALSTGVGRELRARGRKQRDRALRGLLAEHVSHLDARRREMVFAALRQFVRAETYLSLVDEFGLTPDEAAEACAWAVDALTDSLRRHHASGQPTLVDDEVAAEARTLRDRNSRGD
jgi:AcrR family transcriptional regulator